MNASKQSSDADLDRARMIYLNRVLFEENDDQHLIFWVGRSKVDDELRVGIATGFTESDPLDDFREWQDKDWRDLWDLEQEIEDGIYRLGAQIEEPIIAEGVKPKTSLALRLFLIGLAISLASVIIPAMLGVDSSETPLWNLLILTIGNLVIIAGIVLYIRGIIKRIFVATKRGLFR